MENTSHGLKATKHVQERSYRVSVAIQDVMDDIYRLADIWGWYDGPKLVVPDGIHETARYRLVIRNNRLVTIMEPARKGVITVH